MNGKFIVIEGLDGTGKTTQLGLVAERLRALGQTVFTTAEPTKGSTGKLIRNILAGKEECSPWALADLFTADRIIHNTQPDGIAEHIHRGETVLCDRYYYSTFAYQGTDTDIDRAMRSHFSCPEIRRPDMCVFLTATPEKCLERIKAGRAANELEIFETAEKLTAVAKRYANVFSRLGNCENIVTLDASGTIEEVTSLIMEKILPLFEKGDKK